MGIGADLGLNKIGQAGQNLVDDLSQGVQNAGKTKLGGKILDIVKGIANRDGKGGGSNPILPKPKSTLPGDASRTHDKMTQGNPISISEVLSMLHELAVEMKAANKQLRQHNRDKEVQAAYQGADKLRHAANMTLASGCVSGGMQICGGAASFVGACRAGSKSMQGQAGKQLNKQMISQRQQVKAASNEVKTEQKAFDKQVKEFGAELKKVDMKKGPTPEQAAKLKSMKLKLTETKERLDAARGKLQTAKDDLASMEQKFNEVTRPNADKAQRTLQKWQGRSQILIGLGQVASSIADREGKMAEADKAVLDAQQAIYRNMAQDSDETVKDSGSCEQAVREKMSSIEEAYNRISSTVNQI